MWGVQVGAEKKEIEYRPARNPRMCRVVSWDLTRLKMLDLRRQSHINLPSIHKYLTSLG
jgi:hypothetical protein